MYTRASLLGTLRSGLLAILGARTLLVTKGIAIRNKKLLFLWRRDKIEGTTDGLDALR